MIRVIPLRTYIEPEAVIAAIEVLGATIVCLAGAGRHVVVGLEGREVELSEIQPLRVAGTADGDQASEFVTGYVGLMSYDGYCPTAQIRLGHRVFKVTKTLLWDRVKRSMTRGFDNDTGARETWVSEAELHAIFEKLEQTPLQETSVLSQRHPNIVVEGLHRAEYTTEYEHKVRGALEDIRNGQYYQINLLRFFELRHATFCSLLARTLSCGGTHSSAFRCVGLELVSLSPEQFVTVRRMNQTAGSPSEVTTRPVKGTCRRGVNSEEDAALARGLETSDKERAELAMIIDLMRNDLHRVCLAHSVVVKSAGHIEKLPYVTHRLGEVSGILDPAITLGEFLRRLMPAGSITGAPKIAAMEAIRRYENKDRGYFMGAAFCFDPRGYFDSSVLIRTAYRQDAAKNFEFAAGSGIVLMSQPAKEAQECAIKCGALTDQLIQA